MDSQIDFHKGNSQFLKLLTVATARNTSSMYSFATVGIYRETYTVCAKALISKGCTLPSEQIAKVGLNVHVCVSRVCVHECTCVCACVCVCVAGGSECVCLFVCV